VIKREDLYLRPAKLPYPQTRVTHKHYGKFMERMVQEATKYQDGEIKEQLVSMLANQMKKLFLTWNKEVVDDRKIFDDLKLISKGRIVVDESQYKLTESKEILSKKNTNNNKNLQRRQQKKNGK